MGVATELADGGRSTRGTGRGRPLVKPLAVEVEMVQIRWETEIGMMVGKTTSITVVVTFRTMIGGGAGGLSFHP